MKEKLVKLSNGLEYMVIDELNLDNKDYVFVVQVDQLTETITKNYLFVELTTDTNNNRSFKDILDKEIFEKISLKFLEKLNA